MTLIFCSPSKEFVRDDLVSILLVLWILKEVDLVESISLDRKEQAYQNSGFVGVYFETEVERSIAC